MSVLEISIQKNRNKSEAKQGEGTFLEWCDRNGLGKEGYVSYSSSDVKYRGKHVVFYVVCYGSFQTVNGWLIYITYRGDIVNHVRHHTYQWDGKQAIIASHSINEFINA